MRLQSPKQTSLLLIALMAALIGTPGSATTGGANCSESDLTAQSVALFKQGKLDEAQDLANKAIEANPRDWLAHETMSFLHWQVGNVPDAVTEGQKAILYAPENVEAYLNLGHIYQQVGDYKNAIVLYERARKYAPQNWAAGISLVASQIGIGNMSAALAVLSDMATTSHNDFAWHYQVGISYLTIDRPEEAIDSLEKAIKLASSNEQRAEAYSQLLVALLRANKIDRAESILDETVSKNVCRNGETFVRAASALLPIANPSQGQQLLDNTRRNLTKVSDSETFFRLGRIFQKKAEASDSSSTTASAWLENASTAFNHAIELNPGPAKNHLALAGVLQRQGKFSEMADQIQQACTFDGAEPLAQVLNESIRAQSTSLQMVAFKADGLTCNCHATSIHAVLLGMPGTAVIRMSHLPPHDGLLLIDSSVSSSDAVLNSCATKIFPDPRFRPSGFKLSSISKTPVKNLSQAVLMAQDVQFGDVLKFEHQFTPIQPLLPEPLKVTQSDATGAM